MTKMTVDNYTWNQMFDATEDWGDLEKRRYLRYCGVNISGFNGREFSTILEARKVFGKDAAFQLMDSRNHLVRVDNNEMIFVGIIQ